MKKIVALDIGAKIIGVAVAEATSSMALPRDEIAWGGNEALLVKALRELESEGVKSVVVGLPRNPSPSMEEALSTVTRILYSLGWEVFPMDEHVSSQEAANRIAETEEETGVRYPSSRRDSVAAQIILERYLAHE